MPSSVSPARRRWVAPKIAVAVAAFVLSGCTASVDGQAGMTGAAGTAAVSAAGGSGSGAAPSSGAGDSGTPDDSAAAAAEPHGDGTWHPHVRAAADAPAVPDLVMRLLQRLDVVSVMEGSASAMSNYPYTVTVDGKCPAARASMAKQAAAVGLTVTAQGAATLPSASNGKPVDAEWLVVSGDAGAGADLSLVQDFTGPTCSVGGVGFTPVLLHLTGPVAGDVEAFAAVTCAQPFDGAGIVGIWAAPLGEDGGKTVTVMAMGAGDGGPGAYAVGSAEGDDSDSGDDEGGFFTETPQYDYASMMVTSWANTVANSSDDDEDADVNILPPGAQPVAGTVTMARGMASGTLDLTSGEEHIAGSFECGTPVTADK